TGGMAAHLADQVDAEAPGEFADLLDHVACAGVEHLVRPHRGGEVAAGRIEVGGDHQCCSGGAQHSHREAPDRAAADHQNRGSCDVAALQRSVHRVADRVHDRPDVGRDAVELHHVGGRHRDVVGERAVAIDPDDLGADTEVRVAGSARDAVAADDVTLCGNHVTSCKNPVCLRLRSEVDDLPGELVTDNHGGSHSTRCPGIPLPDVQVGAAHSGVVNTDQQIARTHGGLRGLDQPESHVWRGFHDGAHIDSESGKCSNIIACAIVSKSPIGHLAHHSIVWMTGTTRCPDRGSNARGYCAWRENFDLVYADATPCPARGVAAELARTTSFADT